MSPLIQNQRLPTPKEIANAMNAKGEVGIRNLAGWKQLENLSDKTEILGFYAFDDFVTWDKEKKKFIAGIDINVKFNYNNPEDGPSFEGEYPGSYSGHIGQDGRPEIDDISIDLTSFYD